MQITVLQRPSRISEREFPKALESALTLLKGDLSASTKLIGYSKQGWATVGITGNDSEIVSELISRKLGLAQTELNGIAKLGNYDGHITGQTETYLQIDIGIEKPRPLTIKVGLGILRAQLCDAKTLPMEEIIEHYCLFPSTKATVRITNLEPKSEIAEGWIADSHLALFSNRISARLDRIQVFDSSQREVEFAIRKANLGRDIISVEQETLTVQSVVCKLGTDAIGLIPKLGSALRGRELKPFLPRRIVSRCKPW